MLELPECVEPDGLEPPVEEGEEPPPPEPLVPPVSVTLLLRQEESVPPVTVTMSEYAVAPVLSFKAMVLHVEHQHEPKNTQQQRCSQASARPEVHVPSVRSTTLSRELLDLENVHQRTEVQK